MNASIAYFTNRREPMIEWFFRSLRRELRGEMHDQQIIVVDYHADEDGRREDFDRKIREEIPGCFNASGFTFQHVTPKPCAWQGAHRKTKVDHFAASNARNTAFALCRSDYIACIDDLSVMITGWMDQVRHANHGKYVALGAYKKVFDLNITHEGDVTFRPNPSGVDSRWNRGTSLGITEAEGSWLFGCSFALPIEWALRVNGFSERCDGTGMEDVEFGIRLERAGAKFFYNRNMCTYEDDLLHGAPGNAKFLRESIMTKYGVNSDWHIYNQVVQTPMVKAAGNDFDLRHMRERVLLGEPFPMPTVDTDWRTDKKLCDL